VNGGNAEVVNNGDGTFSVTPSPDFTGDLTLTFDISDGTKTISSSNYQSHHQAQTATGHYQC
jgi:hypothetical protein